MNTAMDYNVPYGYGNGMQPQGYDNGMQPQGYDNGMQPQGYGQPGNEMQPPAYSGLYDNGMKSGDAGMQSGDGNFN
jgi:hypothetical protein